jgi:hypothetical protein
MMTGEGAGAEAGAEAGATVVGVVQVKVPQMSEFRQFTAASWAYWQLAQAGHASANPHWTFSSSSQVTELDSPPGRYPARHDVHSVRVPAFWRHVPKAAPNVSQAEDGEGRVAEGEAAGLGAVGAVGSELHPAKHAWESLKRQDTYSRKANHRCERRSCWCSCRRRRKPRP